MADRPNLCLVIVDAYRRDHLGLFEPGYGYTPRLTDRCASWVRFEDARASAPWTLPSCTSILTGVEASRHRRFTHRHPELTAPTIAELLPSEYECAGFVNNGNIAKVSSLDRGFDVHRYFKEHAKALDAARTFLTERRGGRPFFLLVHTNLAHDFYLPEARPYYEDRFGTQGWFELGSRVISWNGTTPQQREAARRSYDASVARMDAEIDRLLGLLDLDTTAVFLTADHGEGFDYDGNRVHHGGRVHDDQVRVPLVAHLPSGLVDRAEAARVSSATVAHVDLVPTLLALAGGAPPPSTDGQDLFGGAHPGADRMVRSEDLKYLYLRHRHRMNTNPRGKNTSQRQRLRSRAFRSTILRNWGVRSLVQRGHKLIVTTLEPGRGFPAVAALPFLRRLVHGDAVLTATGGTVFGLELFDLARDPAEQHNLLPGLGCAAVEQRMPGLAEECLRAGRVERGVLDVLAGAIGA